MKNKRKFIRGKVSEKLKQHAPEPQTIDGVAHRVELPTSNVASLPARLVQENRDNTNNIIVALTSAMKGMSAKGENLPQVAEFMERMVALQTNIEDRQAEREFGVAKVAIASEIPTIPKTKSYEFVDKNNTKQTRMYSDRIDIESVLDPLCKKYGFSKEYTSKTNDKGLTCQVLTLRHAGGHVAVYESPYQPLDTTGAKSNSQAASSTAEYGMKQALKGAFNIIGVDLDDQGDNINVPNKDAAIDKFNDRVKADAANAKPEAKPETPPQGGKLTLEQAAIVLEQKLVAAPKEKRGAILMGHINIIGAMEANDKLAPKAAELRQLCATPEVGASNAAA